MSHTSLRSCLFAAVYDGSLWLGERFGMAERRRRLLAGTHGRVLEIGAGTGLNLGHYPATLDELVLTEPDPAMADVLEQRLRGGSGRRGLVRAEAGALPFKDASFDTAVSTMVLCTVPDPDAAIRELRRVLRPGGRLLFIEHVRSDSPRLARWQDRLVRPWRLVACGCRCNRRTLELLRGGGFDVAAMRESWRAMPPLVRPLVVGEAAR